MDSARQSVSFLCVLRGLSLRPLRSKAFHRQQHKALERKERLVESAKIAKRSYSFATRLARYPTPNVIAVPTITHHVHGTCVQPHRYSSTPNPQTIPSSAPSW